MRQLLIILGLLFVVVAGLTAIAWVRLGRGRHEDLERMGRALAQTVRGVALETTNTVQAAEGYLADRLETIARRADEQIASHHEPAREILQRLAREERIGRLFLLGQNGEPLAQAAWPEPVAEETDALLSADRRQSLAWQSVHRTVRATPVAPEQVRVEGHRTNVFGTRERFGVIYGRKNGGVLVVRAAAEELRALGQRFGLAPVLERIAQVPGVVAVRVREPGGALIAARGEAGEERDPDTMGKSLEVALPVDEPGHPAFVVELVLSRAWADQAADESRRAILLGAGIALIVLAAAIVALRLREEQARRMRASLERQRRTDARLAEMGALAGLVTHEISNPVNALRLGLSVLRATPPGDAQETVLTSLETEIQRIRTTLDGYMALAASPPARQTPVGCEVLQEATCRVQDLAHARGVALDVVVDDPGAQALGEPVVLEQALANVLRNAIQATPAGGTVRCLWEQAPENCLRIVVEDQGPGFPAEGRAQLLRLGGQRRPGGHGLGLPLSRRFVEGFGGRILLEDSAEGGARVVITLPKLDGGDDV